MRITVVKICGPSFLMREMVLVAARYTMLGCLPLVPFNYNEENQATSIDALDEVRIRSIEIADLIHILRYEDENGYKRVDNTTLFERDYAAKLQKPITYHVPPKSYLNTFTVREDNLIPGPIYVDEIREGEFHLTDVYGKRVFVLAKESDIA
jgi:hypothetical protein